MAALAAAASCGAAAATAPGSVAARWTDGPAGPVTTNGYPYARGCPRAGADELIDRWKLDECNCTSYVAWALRANGQRTDWFVAGAMDARNWPHVARLAGLAVGRTPAVGAVAVWPDAAEPFGHVAYVTDLDPDGSFAVAEYNLPPVDGGSRFRFDARHGLTPRGAVFIYVPLRPRSSIGRPS